MIRDAFRRSPRLPHLFLDRPFASAIRAHAGDLRRTVAAAAGARIAIPCLASALAYHDGFARASGSANLIQAQRDFFGAHTFERIDRPGSFHADWSDV
jgi:6-phosphogluconate dehydrogenase